MSFQLGILYLLRLLAWPGIASRVARLVVRIEAYLAESSHLQFSVVRNIKLSGKAKILIEFSDVTRVWKDR